MSEKQNSLPKDMEWVFPFLVYEDAEKAVEWLSQTFGFTERKEKRDTAPDGSVMHAELEHNGDLIMLGGGPNFELQQEKNILLYIYVDDLEAHYKHSQEYGADILKEPENTSYGDRRYWVKDLGGHRWIFAERMREPSEK